MLFADTGENSERGKGGSQHTQSCSSEEVVGRLDEATASRKPKTRWSKGT